MRYFRSLTSVFLICFLITFTSSFKVQNEAGALMYLVRFGYLSKSNMSPSMGIKEAKSSLMTFQKNFHLRPTGQLDTRTMAHMNVPRCGNTDVRPNRSKRYDLFGSTWRHRKLTYKIGAFSSAMQKHVTKAEARETIKKAFGLWSEVTNLDFVCKEHDQMVDIELIFTSEDHPEDEFPFDGPGDILAHAFFPSYGGGVHFDDEEEWRVQSPKGVDLLDIAVHEIGHSLGLDHSSVKGAIMEAYYSGYKPQLKLHPDDIEGIQALYGRRNSPYALQSPDLCSNSKIDAITTLNDGKIYVFQGSYVFQIDSNGQGVIPGWPHRIGSIFKGLDSNIDAAATQMDGKTYFFKGRNYWRFTGRKMDLGFPKIIGHDFVGIPDNIDSSFACSGQFYFTQGMLVLMGDKYWRYNPRGNPHVGTNFPMSLSNWGTGLTGIDAAFQSPQGKNYLFKGSQYYNWDRRTFKVAVASPPYPRSSKEMWFGCSANPPANYRNIREPTLISTPVDDNMPEFDMEGYANDY